MKRSRWMVWLALVLVMAGLVVPVSREAGADELGDASVLASQETLSAEELDRWWGAVGAAMCGLEFRLVNTAPAIGMNPYVMAAGIGGCLLAVLDIATT